MIQELSLRLCCYSIPARDIIVKMDMSNWHGAVGFRIFFFCDVLG
jgi:hypothetical protein